MKKLVLFVLGAIIGALAMYYYCCGSMSMEDESPINEPKGLISPKEAMALDQAYNIKHRIINDSLYRGSKEGGDNRSSWWKIEDIQDYINYAENQAGELGYTMDGLRVYLGSHPNSGGETGLTTMFFIPTGYQNTSQGSMFPSIQGSNDIPGGFGLNMGNDGVPPGANYPQ